MPSFPPDAHREGGAAASVSNRELAREFYAPIIPIVAELRRQGLSLRAIARELDRRGIRTRWVGVSRFLGVGPDGIRLGDPEFIRWSATQVSRVLARAASARGEGGGPFPRAGGEVPGD